MTAMRLMMAMLILGMAAMPASAAKKEKKAKPALHPALQAALDAQTAAMAKPTVEVTGIVKSSADSSGSSTTYVLVKEDDSRVILYKSGGPDGRLFKYEDGCNPELYNNKKVAVTGHTIKHDNNGREQVWMIIIKKVRILGDAPPAAAPAPKTAAK